MKLMREAQALAGKPATGHPPHRGHEIMRMSGYPQVGIASKSEGIGGAEGERHRGGGIDGSWHYAASSPPLARVNKLRKRRRTARCPTLPMGRTKIPGTHRLPPDIAYGANGVAPALSGLLTQTAHDSLLAT